MAAPTPIMHYCPRTTALQGSSEAVPPTCDSSPARPRYTRFGAGAMPRSMLPKSSLFAPSSTGFASTLTALRLRARPRYGIRLVSTFSRLVEPFTCCLLPFWDFFRLYRRFFPCVFRFFYVIPSPPSLFWTFWRCTERLSRVFRFFFVVPSASGALLDFLALYGPVVSHFPIYFNHTEPLGRFFGFIFRYLQFGSGCTTRVCHVSACAVPREFTDPPSSEGVRGTARRGLRSAPLRHRSSSGRRLRDQSARHRDFPRAGGVSWFLGSGQSRVSAPATRRARPAPASRACLRQMLSASRRRRDWPCDSPP